MRFIVLGLLPYACLVLLERWIAAGDVLLERYQQVLAGLAACALATVLIAYGVDNPSANDIALYALPAFLAAAGVVGIGALMAKHTLARCSAPTQAIVLFIGSYIGTKMLFGLAVILQMGLFWTPL